ncbi:MAG TPA: glycosyltransferase family A protein [Streptosporangiaceae bacterium]|nr:glycosyltransferase family A protein [Streptosporangiaceae bacterium]
MSEAPAAETAEEWPPVTVIMPTHGRPELVRLSLEGVIGQTYPGPIDCIVIHDREPAQEELATLGTAQHQVRVTTNTHSPGLAGARNTGLEMATGEFIATCDDDDVWHPTKLQTQVQRLRDEPGLLVVGTGIRLLLPGDQVLDWPGRAPHIEYRLLLRNRVKELHSSTLVMRRELFDSLGGYDEHLPGGYAEDYDFVLRAAKVKTLGMVTEPLADIRKNANSYYQGKAANTAAALEYMLAKHPDFATSRRGHARILGQIAFNRSSMGQRGPALRYAMKSLSRWPVSPYPYIALVQAVGVRPEQLLRAARLLRRGMA